MASNSITKDHHLWTRDTIKNVSGDVTLDIVGDITLDAAGGDVNILQADVTIPIDKKVIFGNTGEYIVGDDTDLDIVSSQDLTITTSRDTLIVSGRNIDLDAVTDIVLDAGSGIFNFLDDGDENDAFKLTVVGGTGATTLETVSEAADGHLSIVADGHVEFASCGVGFAEIEEAFSDDALLTTGGTNDTQIDFRKTNKIYLALTADIDGQMNLIFPAVSGNFLLQVRHDGDHNIAAWKAWESDLSEATVANVYWPGGTIPTPTDSGRDIFSFYWDATKQECFGVATLDFQTP